MNEVIFKDRTKKLALRGIQEFRMKRVLFQLLILLFLIGVSSPVDSGDVSVLMSSNVDASREALQGFRETLRHRIVSEHDMRGSVGLGRKLLT